MKSKDVDYWSKRKWREANREKDRESKRRYVENNREKVKQSKAKWIIKNPVKRKINHHAWLKPIKDCCEWCGSTNFLQRHHPNYSKPKYYLTLCASCHAKTKNHIKNTCKEVILQNV